MALERTGQGLPAEPQPPGASLDASVALSPLACSGPEATPRGPHNIYAPEPFSFPIVPSQQRPTHIQT